MPAVIQQAPCSFVRRVTTRFKHALGAQNLLARPQPAVVFRKGAQMITRFPAQILNTQVVKPSCQGFYDPTIFSWGTKKYS